MSNSALLTRPNRPASHGTDVITIPRHLSGPTGSGHGGAFAGRVAALMGEGPVAVRLHRPIPLATLLRVDVADDGQRVVRWVGRDPGRPAHADDVIATARPADPLPDPPTGVGMITDLRWIPSSLIPALADHPCPTCFACGPERTDGIGLRPRMLGGVCVSSWVPEVHGLGTGDGVPDWMVWAALDCGSAGPAIDLVEPHEAVLTGELIADLRRPARVGAELRLSSRVLSHEGRRTVTEVALLEGPEILAVARATWITVDRTVLRRLAAPAR